jgi:N-acetylglucosamine-6-phosphate deacetylase
MNSFLITQVRLVEPGRDIRPGALLVRDGQIAAFGSRVDAPAGTTVVDGGGRLLTPGLIDVHTHGVGQNLYERTPAEIVAGGALLPSFGVTTVLPTLYRVMHRSSLKHLAALAEVLPKVKGAKAPGFHLEGPFLALPGAGAETIPGDLGLLDELLAVCGGRVSAMSISPDSVNILPIIERLCERGVVPFITHTRATVEQTQAALDAGARHATHFYDVFPLPPETDGGVRPVGAVETMLADPRATVDFIADGTHVHPMAIRCAVAAKGWGGVVLITDSNIGAGLPHGEYATPWGFPVNIGPRGGARIADPKHPHFGSLAGSALTMNVGMKNLLQWLDLPPAQVWAMGTLNVARMMGWKNKGRIEVGAAADLVLWNDDFTPVKTWCGGECVYERI